MCVCVRRRDCTCVYVILDELLVHVQFIVLCVQVMLMGVALSKPQGLNRS